MFRRLYIISSCCSCAYVEILSTQEVWRALKGLELHSAAPRATLTPLSCSLNFPCAQQLNIRTLTHELLLLNRVGAAVVSTITSINDQFVMFVDSFQFISNCISFFNFHGFLFVQQNLIYNQKEWGHCITKDLVQQSDDLHNIEQTEKSAAIGRCHL